MQATIRKRRSRYAKLPLDARLLVRVLEIIFPTCCYAEGNRYTSRAMRAALRTLQPGSEEGIVRGRQPKIWFVKSESRPKFGRWYAVDLNSLSCDVDTSRMVLPPHVHIDPDRLYCEDFRNGKLCYHILVAAIAEAVRQDSLEFSEEE